MTKKLTEQEISKIIFNDKRLKIYKSGLQWSEAWEEGFVAAFEFKQNEHGYIHLSLRYNIN